MASTLMNEGLTLMLVGMGTVFVFLTVLVGAMSLMSRLTLRFQPDTPLPGGTDDEIAAITAAIAVHRRKQ
jgi:oxaloacetate decarboxylase gamma subunit